MLKTWGVDQVYIKGKPEKDGKTDCEDESDSKESIEAELKARFADVIDDPVMEEIMKAAGRQLLKNLRNPGKENEHT